ncbi:hypothetical protein POVWA2_018440 [Plasmodium ovale wallikeri]|uniref:Uncharacterized protein n=1 Tax=Plasmodium ovale wallikeri TaxID=864142 RepID=A0A1A8YQJ7_PLAOA|nr:hypothetical protein POVWA1_018550 [Plasmodium ovale wallikeri]SBT34134.1 hypothetical protein POVWA2_018440 [Plasmodium ovale wallikeri]
MYVSLHRSTHRSNNTFPFETAVFETFIILKGCPPTPNTFVWSRHHCFLLLRYSPWHASAHVTKDPFFSVIFNLITNLSRINNCQFLHSVHILNGDRTPLRFGEKTYVQNNDLLQIVRVKEGGEKK